MYAFSLLNQVYGSHSYRMQLVIHHWDKVLKFHRCIQGTETALLYIVWLAAPYL